MKKISLILSVLTIVALTGCISSPVPTSKFSGTIGGQKFNGEFPKDTTITNLVVEINTNGTAKFSIGFLQAANSSNVIGASYAGRADEFNAFGNQLNSAFKTGIGAVGTIGGAAIKAP